VIVLGLILIVLAVAAGVLLFMATAPLTDTVQLEALGVKAEVLPLALLIAGAAVLLLLWLGLVMIRGSVRRKTRRRREAKELERQAQRDAEARRSAEARADEGRSEPVPAARYADTRERPGDGWADDTTPGRRASTGSTTTTSVDAGAATVEPSTRRGPDAPTRTDRIMGRDDRETYRA
jgi:membrane protein implicated in regulation of membrane protease activity